MSHAQLHIDNPMSAADIEQIFRLYPNHPFAIQWRVYVSDKLNYIHQMDRQEERLMRKELRRQRHARHVLEHEEAIQRARQQHIAELNAALEESEHHAVLEQIEQSNVVTTIDSDYQLFMDKFIEQLDELQSTETQLSRVRKRHAEVRARWQQTRAQHADAVIGRLARPILLPGGEAFTAITDQDSDQVQELRNRLAFRPDPINALARISALSESEMLPYARQIRFNEDVAELLKANPDMSREDAQFHVAAQMNVYHRAKAQDEIVLHKFVRTSLELRFKPQEIKHLIDDANENKEINQNTARPRPKITSLTQYVQEIIRQNEPGLLSLDLNELVALQNEDKDLKIKHVRLQKSLRQMADEGNTHFPKDEVINAIIDKFIEKQPCVSFRP